MPDTHFLSQGPDTPVEDRFLSWMDELVDPAMEITVPDPDLADLAGTAAFVQQVAGLDGTAALAPGRADAIWEDIMNTTTATPTVVPTLPSSSSEPPLRPARPITKPNPGWRSYLARALLIAAIVAASAATIWRLAGPFDFGGNGTDDNRAHQPGIAGVAPSIPGTPSILAAQEFASPEAEATACDVSGDVPIVTDVDSPSWSNTALVLADGTLTLRCDKTSSFIAEVVTEVLGTTWPGAVLLHMEDGSMHGVNLVTGAEGDLGPYIDQVQPPYGRVTRWMFYPTSPEMLDWRIIDLETMESLLLSDELGGVLPRSTVAQLWVTTPDAAVVGLGGTPIIAGQVPTGPSNPGGATPLPGTPTGELPFEWSALVIDGSLSSTRWTETARPSRVTAGISPDGELLAIQELQGDALTVRVQRLADGELVAETGIDYGAGDSMILLNDGAGLLHLSQDRLDLVTWNEQGPVTNKTLMKLEARQGVPVLVQTADPDVALVGSTSRGGTSVGYLVDVGSGTVTEVSGLLPVPFVNEQYMNGVPPRYVLAAAKANEQQSAVRMIDVTTGEAVLESDLVDLPLETMTTQDAALRDGGTVGMVFLPDGTTRVLDARTGEAFTIAPPEGTGPWTMLPSPTGTFLVAYEQTTRLFHAVTSDSSWDEVPADTPVGFVPGTGTPAGGSPPD